MRRSNYCEFFRFNDQYCDVFIEGDAFLYAEAEPFNWPYLLTCKEYRPAENGGFIVSDYCGADVQYLEKLEPAPVDIAEEIIASEERYTLECMAPAYGYTRSYILECYKDAIDAGDDPHDAYITTAACMMEYDL